jgi:ABC-type transport system involved in cytochrome bd biosynthesis fused ATPase/permease subunit
MLCTLFFFALLLCFAWSFTLGPARTKQHIRHANGPLSSTAAASTTPYSNNAGNKKRQEDYARGAALLVKDVSISRGPAQILKNIDWRVEPKTKWALIGGNGAGKSTMLKAICGEILYDGNIFLGHSENDIGYLRQTAVSGSNKTVFDEAASGMVELQRAKDRLEAIQSRIAKGGVNDNDLQELDKAAMNYEAAGGYTQEQKVATVLKGLGFHDLEIRCDELSGGWQMRGESTALVSRRSKPPTNHKPANSQTPQLPSRSCSLVNRSYV